MRFSGYGISRKTFNEIEELMRALDTGSRQFAAVQNVAGELLAHTTLGFARQKYSGTATRPADARRGLGAPPWTIPVRRITGRTLKGWRVKRVGNGWMTYNDERGAYMVEHGIARGGGGIRRPILKMSVISTLRFMGRTKMGERIMHDTFGSLRNNRGQFQSTAARMRGSNILGVTGPSGRLP